MSTSAAAELVGLRFNPTDQELVNHYLKIKMHGKDSHFPEIHCCQHEPRDLLQRLATNQDIEGFFYSPRDYKYAKSKRSNRATKEGHWKITGKPRVIKDLDTNDVIGYKNILTFHIGRGFNSQKTNFVMHEYDLPNQNGDYVLCRLKLKRDKSAKKKGSSICEEADPDMIENQPADDMIPERDKELEDPRLPNGNVGEYEESQKYSFLQDENDISLEDYGFSSDLDMFPEDLLPSPIHGVPRDVLPGNEYIAGKESQSQLGDYDFSLTEIISYLEKTQPPSIDSNQPRSLGTQPPSIDSNYPLGTQPPSNYSIQGHSALATGETLQCS